MLPSNRGSSPDEEQTNTKHHPDTCCLEKGKSKTKMKLHCTYITPFGGKTCSIELSFSLTHVQPINTSQAKH